MYVVCVMHVVTVIYLQYVCACMYVLDSTVVTR